MKSILTGLKVSIVGAIRVILLLFGIFLLFGCATGGGDDVAPEAPPPAGPGETPPAEPTVKECLGGKIAFRPPSPMKQGETRQFTVNAVIKNSPADPTEDLPGKNQVQVRNTPICKKMRAELTGAGFKIERLNSTTGQIYIPPDGRGQWSWNITPTESGQKELTLTLFAPGQDNWDMNLETYTEPIEVRVGFWYAIGEWIKNWWVLIGGGVIALVGAVWAFFKWKYPSSKDYEARQNRMQQAEDREE